MWSLRRSGTLSGMSSSDYDSSQGSILVSSETSTVPSRLDSFSSSNGAVPCNDFNMQTSFDFDLDNQIAIPSSPLSSESSHDKQGSKQLGTEAISTTNSTADQSTSDNAEIASLESAQAERAVSPTIQKWVDESCVETERLKSAVCRFSDEGAIKDEEIEEEASPPSDYALQQALEYSLRAVSPSFARTASLDAGFSALGDYHSQLTPTESMLLGLGFGGPDLGIPVRFLKSWREQVIKRKIMELQGLLGRSRKSPSPTGSARQYAAKSPRGGESSSPRKKAIATEAVSSPEKKVTQSTNQLVPSPKAAVKPSKKQLQLEKLHEMRQKLRKSATISSFSPSLLPDSNHLFGGKDMKKKGAMSDKKYQKFRGATRGNAKDRRRKFGTRQSSLPISLETLPEEDEGRPAFLQQKSSSFDFLDNRASSNTASTATSVNSSKVDIRDEGELDNVEGGIHSTKEFSKTHPTITVMSEPSVDGDQRPSFVPEIETKESGKSEATLDGKHLLAIKGIIESKDSGFGNDISNEGTPQLSPEHCPKTLQVENRGKNELHLQECPQEKEEQGEGPNLGDDQSTSLPTALNSRSNVQREKGNPQKKRSQRVDLCIQVDFPEVFSEDESDVEFSSAGVQTSPWLQSCELSPLYGGHFTYNPNEPPIESPESTSKHDREIREEVLGNNTLPPPFDSQSPQQNESSQESFGTKQGNITEGLNPGEVSKVIEEDRFSESSNNVGPAIAKIDSIDKSITLKEPNFLDGFNSEKRRLSRIEEVTESTLSLQSEEERTKNSFESQFDSSQTTSTSSTSRPSSSLVLLGTDFSKHAEDTTDLSSLKRAQSHSKKLAKQVYKEMLERNIAGDLSNEKDLLLLRTNYQAERSSSKLTVDETLLQAAQKLEMCAKDQDSSAPHNDFSGDTVEGNDYDSSKEVEKQIESILPTEIDPVNKQVSHPEESMESHVKLPGLSQHDQLGSQQSRRFFSTQSFSSFTDAVKDGNSSCTNSNASDATIDFDGGSFFSIPVDEEQDVNFSLIGSDMNLMSSDEANHHNTQNPKVASSRGVTTPDEFSLEELDYKYLQENDKEKHLKHFFHSYARENYNDVISTISSVESGAFFSETINDDMFLGKEVYSQSLEINVPRLCREDAVFLSHQSFSLSTEGRKESLKNTDPVFQEKQTPTIKVPFNYSSKYYFSVEDYRCDSDEDLEDEIKPLDRLSRRRQSLINAHLAAKGYHFDETIDEASSYDTKDRREDCLPLMAVPVEEKTVIQKVRDNLTLGSFEEDNIFAYMTERERNIRAKKSEWYGKECSDKWSVDSDLSLGSSTSSSKVDGYVDAMLDNALQEVRSQEFHCNWTQNGKHRSFEMGEGNSKSMKKTSNFKNGSQFNHRTNIGNGLLGDKVDHGNTIGNTPVEIDGIRQILPETVPTLNNKFTYLKAETLGQEKIHLDRMMVGEIPMQNLTDNSVSIGKHYERRQLPSTHKVCNGSYMSTVNEKNKGANKTESSMNPPQCFCDTSKEKLDFKNESNRAVISLGSVEQKNLNNGVPFQELGDRFENSKKEGSRDSTNSKFRASAKSSDLMPSYDELYSKAENLISNLDALNAGTK